MSFPSFCFCWRAPLQLRLAAATLAVIALAALVVPASASAEPPADETRSNPESSTNRAGDLIEAGGVLPADVPELVTVSTRIEHFALTVEGDVDLSRTAVAVLDARVSAHELKAVASSITFDALEELALTEQMTREVVDARNQRRILQWEITAENAAARELQFQLQLAEQAHARNLEALMVVWSLRQQAASDIAELAALSAGKPVASEPAAMLRNRLGVLLDEAQSAVQRLDVAPPPFDIGYEVGTDTAPADAASMLWPAIGAVNSGYGMRVHPVWGGYRMHHGIDIDADNNDDLVATADGVVVRSGWNGGYGNTVEVDHGNGLSTLYAHMARLDVEVGDEVVQGQLLGLVGATGTATDAHVHFEVRIDGTGVDPLIFLP